MKKSLNVFLKYFSFHPLLAEILGKVVPCTFLFLRQVDSSVLVLVLFLRAQQGPKNLRSTPRTQTRMLTSKKKAGIFVVIPLPAVYCNVDSARYAPPNDSFGFFFVF